MTIGSQLFSFDAEFDSGFHVVVGNDVALLAIPEPGAAVSLLGGLGLLPGLQRFRRRRA